MWDVANSYFGTYCRYYRGYERYKEMCDKKLRSKQRNVEVTLITGPTGAGKTKQVFDKEGDENVFTFESVNGAEWWCGYDGEQAIILDDYNNDFKISRMLRILDRYKLKLPIKGGHTWANFTRIYITTNLKLDELHSNAKPEHIRALRRRITNIIDLWPDNESE